MDLFKMAAIHNLMMMMMMMRIKQITTTKMVTRILRQKEVVSIKVATSQTQNRTIHYLIMMKMKIINNKRIKTTTKTFTNNLNLIPKEKKRESSKELAGKRS